MDEIHFCFRFFSVQGEENLAKKKINHAHMAHCKKEKSVAGKGRESDR